MSKQTRGNGAAGHYMVPMANPRRAATTGRSAAEKRLERMDKAAAELAARMPRFLPHPQGTVYEDEWDDRPY